LPRGHGDPVLAALVQVLTNLLDNAIEYRPAVSLDTIPRPAAS
jgi:signal transduction histidine kinase